MIFMKWTDVKKEITSISPEDKNLIELMALLASIRKEKNMTQKELAYVPSLKTVTKIADGLNLEITFVDKNTKQPVRN